MQNKIYYIVKKEAKKTLSSSFHFECAFQLCIAFCWQYRKYVCALRLKPMKCDKNVNASLNSIASLQLKQLQKGRHTYTRNAKLRFAYYLFHVDSKNAEPLQNIYRTQYGTMRAELYSQ